MRPGVLAEFQLQCSCRWVLRESMAVRIVSAGHAVSGGFAVLAADVAGELHDVAGQLRRALGAWKKLHGRYAGFLETCEETVTSVRQTAEVLNTTLLRPTAFGNAISAEASACFEGRGPSSWNGRSA